MANLFGSRSKIKEEVTEAVNRAVSGASELQRQVSGQKENVAAKEGLSLGAAMASISVSEVGTTAPAVSDSAILGSIGHAIEAVHEEISGPDVD